MALLSPGIELKEQSVQQTIVNSSTGTAVTVGKFRWGPVGKVQQVISEPDLFQRFDKPDNLTADSFFSGSNFLQYGNDLRLVRICDEEKAQNASPLTSAIDVVITTPGTGYSVDDVITVKYDSVEIEKNGKVTAVNSTGGITSIFIPNSSINELIADNATNTDFDMSKFTLEVTSVSGADVVFGALSVNEGERIYIPNDDFAQTVLEEPSIMAAFKKYNIPTLVAKYPGEYGNRIKCNIVSYAEFKKSFDGNITITGFPSGNVSIINVRQAFQYGPESPSQFIFMVTLDNVVVESRVLSLTHGDRDIFGNSIFVDDFFNRISGSSAYIQGNSINWPTNFTGSLEMSGGDSSNDTVTAGNWMEGWDNFSDKEMIIADLFIAGSCAAEGAAISSTVQKYVADLTTKRADAIAFISPPRELLINKSASAATDAMIEWRNGTTTSGAEVENNMNINTTYAFIDANYKFIYDKYNDVNRWVPFAADMAGLCANTDRVSYPWMSPAGPNRGVIRGVIKLAVETRNAHRDRLYLDGLNPIVGFAGSGFLLYGDKMATTVSSPFDRINVRRLFNLLKRNLANNAFQKLFELNDYFTRYSYRTDANAYLSQIKALGGVYDFQVQCDENNNTGAIIDSNQFVATFWIKPTRSINFITLTLAATGTDANFEELISGATV